VGFYNRYLVPVNWQLDRLFNIAIASRAARSTQAQ
jgi:hypothetical protein